MQINAISDFIMSLTLVATPMGNIEDISIRAKKTLEACEVLILEEFREGSSLIKALGIERKDMHQLNEHSKEDDIQDLFELCKTKECALISDCGTPNFCDPGAALVKMCRKNGVPVDSVPGPSSLMHILSLSSERLNEFYFRGFLPAKSDARSKAIEELKTDKRPMIIMDTPYRLKKTITELAEAMPKRKALLGINLTQEDQMVLENQLGVLATEVGQIKAEFMLLIYQS